MRVIVAERGEAARPSQPVFTLEATHVRWFAFNVREDRLGALAIGSPLAFGLDRQPTECPRSTRSAT